MLVRDHNSAKRSAKRPEMAPMRARISRSSTRLGGLARLRRRVGGWYTHRLSPGKLWNCTLAATEFFLRRKKLRAFPLALKIDISPLCNLRCTICVHARPNGVPDLERQHFDKSQRMSLDQYTGIIDQIRGKSNVVVLHYLGDPLMHPDCLEMIRIGSEAGLCVQFSSNLSYRFSDEKIEEFVTSGLTHLRVCIDGLRQETYQRTRVGGNIELVMSNLKRLIAAKRKLRRKTPRIEVQYIKFHHNVAEAEPARIIYGELGVDRFTSFWGNLGNYTEMDPDKYNVLGPKSRRWYRPNCLWPYFAMLIKYNGDVLPCCNHRQGAQYATGGDCRAVGNVFETSLHEAWNSPGYQKTRQLLWNPGLAENDSSYEELFCNSCRSLFTNDCRVLIGPRFLYDQFFTIDEKGAPARRPRALRPQEQGAAPPPDSIRHEL